MRRKFPASKLNSLLTMLELRGIIVKAPGGNVPSLSRLPRDRIENTLGGITWQTNWSSWNRRQRRKTIGKFLGPRLQGRGLAGTRARHAQVPDRRRRGARLRTEVHHHPRPRRNPQPDPQGSALRQRRSISRQTRTARERPFPGIWPTCWASTRRCALPHRVPRDHDPRPSRPPSSRRAPSTSNLRQRAAGAPRAGPPDRLQDQPAALGRRSKRACPPAACSPSPRR